MGMVDLNNYSLLLLIPFMEISGSFPVALAVVREYQKKYGKKHSKEAVIDTSGKWMVPFGVYNEIHTFSEGYAVVRKGDFPKSCHGLIDTKGKQLFLRRYPCLCMPGRGDM